MVEKMDGSLYMGIPSLYMESYDMISSLSAFLCSVWVLETSSEHILLYEFNKWFRKVRRFLKLEVHCIVCSTRQL